MNIQSLKDSLQQLRQHLESGGPIDAELKQLLVTLDQDIHHVITRQEVGLLFDDDCFRVEIGYRRDNTRVRASGPSDGVYLRLNLATFGGSGYGQGGLR